MGARRTMMGVLALALVVGACGGGADSDDAGGTDVSAGRGDALAQLTVIDDGAEHRPAASETFLAAATGDPLGVADLVRTDTTGFAQIDYVDGSVTRLDVGTEFEVVALGGTSDDPDVRIRLEVGRLWNRVDSVTGDVGRFEVATSVATAAVRGTVFTVDCEAGGACVFAVLEGQVEVRVGDERIAVAPGERLTVEPDGSAQGPDEVGVEALRADPWVARNLEVDEAQQRAADRQPLLDQEPDRTDTEGDLGAPTLDVIATYSGSLPDGRAWVLFEFAQPWPHELAPNWAVALTTHVGGGILQYRYFNGSYDESVSAPGGEASEVGGGLLFMVPEPPTGSQYSWVAQFNAGTPPADGIDDREAALIEFALDNVLDPREELATDTAG